MKGWVYIISNKAIPGVIKVGYSTKDPSLRAAELGTGAPVPYQVEYEALVDNPRQIEKLAHEMLAFVNAGKEWFECDVGIALKAIKTICADKQTYFERYGSEGADSTVSKMEKVELSKKNPSILKTAPKTNDNYELANQYDSGVGQKKNLKEAFRLFLEAAQEGYELAQLKTGMCYLKGRGIEKNEEKALHFFKLAASSGNIEAKYQWGLLAYLEGEEALSFKLFLEGAQEGHVGCQAQLGCIYYLKNNHQQSFHWYRLAAEQGDAYAQRNLADCYVEAIGCTRDLKTAKHWYELAAKQKDKPALKRLAEWDFIEHDFQPPGKVARNSL